MEREQLGAHGSGSEQVALHALLGFQGFVDVCVAEQAAQLHEPVSGALAPPFQSRLQFMLL